MSTSSLDVGAMIQGGTGIGEIIAGVIGTNKSKDAIKEWKEKYPEMEIPEAIIQATDLYRQDAQRTRLPGQDLYEQQIQQGTAQGIGASREAATSAADLLGATTSLYGQQSRAMTNLQIEGARQQAQNRQLYGQQLNTLGQWQQQQYYMNEYQPWVAQMNTLQGTLQSSYDMLTGGIGTLAGSGSGMDFSSGSGSLTNSGSGYSNPQGYGVQGIDPAMNDLNYQPTSLNEGAYSGQTLGQNKYNPSGQQTLGQYQYNPSGGQTLGSYMYG